MQERIILFDLDGTLTDSGPGIMKASQFALHAYGVARDWQELDFFVGPPLDETFGQFMPKEDIPGAIDQFRVYYHDVGWLENEPYPGVREMLDTLQKNGFRLFVATSKLESMAVQVLGHFGLAPYFEAICGAPGDNTQAGKKVNVIRAALQKAGCTDLTQAMIVGDRKHDIIGGKLAGIRTAGILYGYGSREELAQAGADLICRTPEEFTKIMLSEQQGDKRMNATERKIAEDLLSIRAVFFRPDEPFTWASGIKSPVYCDNRLILTAPDVRTEVETAIMQTIEREYPQAEVLMGTSTAGIAHAAIVGHMMKLPMGYVRGSSKDHGRQNQIEGRLEKGQKVVVVEDLVSTGGSVLDVVKVLRAAGAEVLGVVSIFTYGMKKGLERLAAANVKNVSLTNFDVIAAVAAEQNYIKQEDVVRLIQFRNNPGLEVTTDMNHLIDILQLSTQEIDELVEKATDIIANPEAYAHKCDGKILATLFFEPSTRTRLSFESAMLSLGGKTLGFSSANSSSAAKGESVADTVRTVSCYADIIAMRHPKEGAPLVASMRSEVPVINAGDGGHNHPTQTLTDLLTINREKGRFNDLTVGFCGDLKFGRTVHSLISALSRYTGIKFVLVSPEELKLPSYVKNEVIKKNNIPYEQTTDLESVMPELDILYMTRVQRERFFNEEDYLRLKDSYILTPEKLKTAKQDLCIMHPLPRVNEISVAVDDDPRACYFKQVRNGRYIRMALIMKMLGIE